MGSIVPVVRIANMRLTDDLIRRVLVVISLLPLPPPYVVACKPISPFCHPPGASSGPVYRRAFNYPVPPRQLLPGLPPAVWAHRTLPAARVRPLPPQMRTAAALGCPTP